MDHMTDESIQELDEVFVWRYDELKIHDGVFFGFHYDEAVLG